MTDKSMYRVEVDGKVTWSTERPTGGEYEIRHRLIADEGKALTNGTDVTPCVDVIDDDVDAWYEIDDPDMV